MLDVAMAKCKAANNEPAGRKIPSALTIVWPPPLLLRQLLRGIRRKGCCCRCQIQQSCQVLARMLAVQRSPAEAAPALLLHNPQEIPLRLWPCTDGNELHIECELSAASWLL